MKSLSKIVFVLSFVFVAAVISAPAAACNVPVFRYALERWPVDPYLVVVIHKGPLDAESKKLVEKLEASIVGDLQVGQNFQLMMIDTAGELSEEDKQVLDAVKPKEFPFLFVQYPGSKLVDPSAYTGPLKANIVNGLADSPMRQEIAKHLLKGESVVWLLIEGGTKQVDDKAAKLLESELKRLEKTLKLPVLEATDDQFIDRDRGPELKLSFKMVRMSRKAAQEQMFIRLLQNYDPLKDDERAKPVVFSFFGRGRSMPAMIGKGINPQVIQQDATYLIGPCSCQIKQQNPGFDVLTQINWDGVIQGHYTLAEAMPKLTTASAAAGGSQTALQNLNIDPMATGPADNGKAKIVPTAGTSGPPVAAIWRNLGIVIGVGVVLVLIAGVSMRMRKGSV